jgi:ABC-type nitrate/sulfonate/bicarbonate transport system substrate-binding protein
MSHGKLQILKRRDPLRVGFLPVSDCAPLVYAKEAGLFAKFGLEVELRRETRWGDLRDKVIYGELDAAHAPAPIPFLANLGIDSDPFSCVSGLVLNLQGNAITISRQLWEEGVRDPDSLRQQIYLNWGKKTYTFGVSHTFSSHYYLLLKWLKSAGIVPDREVRIIVIPPAQMFPTLKLGYIDGFCVGEPWTSLAVQAEEGVCIATSAGLAPLHPEKVLMVRQAFSLGRADEHELLIAALLESCAFCDLPQNRSAVATLLALPHYVDAPEDCLNVGLAGALVPDLPPAAAELNLNIFHRFDANDPTDEKAAWIINLLYELLEQTSSHRRGPPRRAPILKNAFRRDIFNRARKLLNHPQAAANTGPENYEPAARQKA